MFPEQIETARLTLEALRTDTVDVPTLHQHVSEDREAIHDEWEYLPWEPKATMRETREWVVEAERQWENRERATYLIRAKAPVDGAEVGEIVGATYLDCFWERRTGEMVMWTRRPFWGRGMLTEYGVEIHDLGFCDLELELMIADAIRGNDRAKSMFEHFIEAFDGQYDGVVRNKVPMDGEVKDVHRFSITRQQYREAMGYLEEETAATETGEADATAD